MDNGGSITASTFSTAIAATTTTSSGRIYHTGTSLAPPEGSNNSHGPTVFATTIAFLVLAFLSVALRMIARAVIVRKMRIDDYLILLAYALSFGMCLSILLGVESGFGRHSWTIPYDEAVVKQRYQFAFTLLFNPAVAATKVSILAFYLIIFKVQKHFRLWCWITMAVVVIAGVALTLLLGFRCSPISRAFDPESNRVDFEGCIGIVRIYFASAPVNIITNLAIMVLPIPVLTSLRLPTRQKAVLVVVFSLGIFDIAVGIVRIHYFQLSDNQVLDFDYNAAYSFMWAAIEVNVGIVCASIPMTKPLISKFFPTWLGTTSLSEGANGTQYDPTSYGNGTPVISMVRRNTIGSAASRPSIGVGWMSAYGDSRAVVDGEAVQVATPTSPRSRRSPHPSSKLEAELWEDNDIFITTPPSAVLPRIAESATEWRWESMDNSGTSGSTAINRHGSTDSRMAKGPTSPLSGNPPWEKMEFPDVASDTYSPLDGGTAVERNGNEEIPPWEKLELHDLGGHSSKPVEFSPRSRETSVQLSDPGPPKGLAISKAMNVDLDSIDPKDPLPTSRPVTSSPSNLDPGSIKTKPERLSIEIPPSRSGPVPQISEPNISPTETVTPLTMTRPVEGHRPERTAPEPLIPTPSGLSLNTLADSVKHSSSVSSGEAPLGARKEQIDVGELAHEKEVVQQPDDTTTPITETPPWEKMSLADLGGKARMSQSLSPEDLRRPAPPKHTATDNSIFSREQYERIGSIIDPSTPESGLATPAWAREEDLREDDGETPPPVIGTKRGTFKIGETPPRERKLKEYFGEESIGALIDLASASGSRVAKQL